MIKPSQAEEKRISFVQACATLGGLIADYMFSFDTSPIIPSDTVSVPVENAGEIKRRTRAKKEPVEARPESDPVANVLTGAANANAANVAEADGLVAVTEEPLSSVYTAVRELGVELAKKGMLEVFKNELTKIGATNAAQVPEDKIREFRIGLKSIIDTL